MKLSEILLCARKALQSCLDDEEAVALRAIAPALVGLVQHSHDWHLHNPADPYRERCEICRLFDAMKEAGVSCD